MSDLWKTQLEELVPEFTEVNGKKVYSERTLALMNIIEHGIPKAEHPKNVAIVGAGVSGMLAASLLASAGHRVSIYEGSMRVGGRIKTIREPFLNNDSGEAGAMRLVTSYQLVYKLIAKFKLPMHTFVNMDAAGQQLIYVNGVKITTNQYNTDPDLLKFKTVGPERGQTASALWTIAIQPIMDMLVPNNVENWAKVVEQYDQYSVRDYLKTVATIKGQPFSEGAIEMIEVMQNLESRSDLGLIQQIVETLDHSTDDTYFAITGGMDRLPDEMYQYCRLLGVNFYFNHLLVGIDRGEQVTLHFEGSRPQQGNGLVGYGVPAPPINKTAIADDVILTIPFPSLRTLQVNPPFSQEKRKTIRELNYNGATKIFLQFSNRFWETDYGIYGGQVITDLASRFIYFPSTDFGGTDGGVVISSYVWASEAAGWDSLTDEMRVRYTLNDLAVIFGESIRESFVLGTSQSWQNDIYTKGEAAMLSPGQFMELEGYVQQAEDNIHFGGDATSFKIAWIEGAIEAGIRTALEVNA